MPNQDFGFFALLPFIIFAIPFAFGNYFLARRLGKNEWVWAILTIIPGVNFVFIYYLLYILIFAVLDRLKALGDALRTDEKGQPAD